MSPQLLEAQLLQIRKGLEENGKRIKVLLDRVLEGKACQAKVPTESSAAS